MKKIFLVIMCISIFFVSNLLAQPKEPIVLIKTTLGDIKVKLYNETPKHRDNFLKLVNKKFYDSLLFHRVIKNFMIQGGDPDSKHANSTQALGMGGPGYTIPAEFVSKIYHKKGALATARDGNPKKESNGSQFYIVQGQIISNQQLDQIEQQKHIKYTPEQRKVYTTIGGTPQLDQDYTVFGEVVSGLDVLDKIEAVQTGQSDRPVTDVRIISMTVVK
jgi:cyclophilin family peptidyl-prolyl cis-trans isomerase